MAAFIDSAVLLLIVAGVCSIGAAVIDIDSPSPASQRLVSSHSNSDSSEMFSSSQKRPMETIDDLMNALAQVTKSKGKYHTVQSKQTNSYRKSSQSTLGYRWIRNRKNRIYCIHLSFQRLLWIFLVSLSFGRDGGGERIWEIATGAVATMCRPDVSHLTATLSLSLSLLCVWEFVLQFDTRQTVGITDVVI